MFEPQWFAAVASVASAVTALALAFGLKEWVFRPRVALLLRDPSLADEVSDRVVTRRIDSGEVAAFVRLRVANRGRSTALRVGVRVLQVYCWDDSRQGWVRARPELDGRLLQPSNQLPNDRDPATVDVFPDSDRIVDLCSVGREDGARLIPLFVEIDQPWPPNRANVLEAGLWQLVLLLCGDNITAQRYFVTVYFDGQWQEAAPAEIWDHFRVEGPFIRLPSGTPEASPSKSPVTESSARA